MPGFGRVQNAQAMALQLKNKLEQELFREIEGTTDVLNARLPDGKSLIADNGDFILYRFTGSEMYAALREKLPSMMELSERLPVITPEKAAIMWMARIFDWVESIKNAGNFKDERLVITMKSALEILQMGHEIFYTAMAEVQSWLRGEKVGVLLFPDKVEVTPMKGCTGTLGLGLLSWATCIFECLKNDIDKEDEWKKHVLRASNDFTAFEMDGSMVEGRLLGFRDATGFKDKVHVLLNEASNLIVQDDGMMIGLISFIGKMNSSDMFKRHLEAERIAIEQRKYLLEKEKFESPQNVVDDRYGLLESLLHRLPSSEDEATILDNNVDDNSMFAGEPSIRDKSRLLLEKSLLTGTETLGLGPKDPEIQDFCSLRAWELEDAVHEKFHNSVGTMSNEYRDKVRSLRFNLQDPKNPILCARVLAGDLPISELITASSEALASNELKLKRRKVEEEVIKNIVLSADSTKQKQVPAGMTSDLASKMGKDTPVAKSLPPTVSSTNQSEDTEASTSIRPTSIVKDTTLSPSSLKTSLLGEYLEKSPSSPSIHSSPQLSKKTSEILASLPPPPMQKVKKEGSAADEEFPSPPSSPVLYSPSAPSHTPNATARPHHISSQSGTDLFQITISKLKVSFTTKMAIDPSCNFDLDRFLPSILVEKVRT